MKPEEAKKLLGGYATGTLTPEEQQALFAAALEDQELFDALACEQSLKDTLDDPSARAELLDVVTERKRGWFARWWPVPAGAGAVALAGLTVFLMMRHEQPVTWVADSRSAPVIQPVQQAAQPAESRSAGVGLEAKKAAPEPTPARAFTVRTDELARKSKVTVSKLATQAEIEKQAEPDVAPPTQSLRAEARDSVRSAPIGSAEQSTPGRMRVAPPPAPATTMGAMAAMAPPPAKSVAPPPPPPTAQDLFEHRAMNRAPAAVLGLRAGSGGGGAKEPRAGAVSGYAAQMGLAGSLAAEGSSGMKYVTGATGAVTVESNFDGYLQGFRKENGEWLPMGPALPVTAHVEQTVQAGTGKDVALVLSRFALPALAATGGRLTSEVEALRGRESRQLRSVLGEVHYAVDATRVADAVLVVTIQAGQK